MISLAVRDGRAVFGGAHQAGVYQLRSGDRTESFCVNLEDPGETEIAPAETASATLASDEELTRPVDVARWFALAALALLALEAWAYHRRWRVC